MAKRSLSAAKFRAQCLTLLDDVEAGGEVLVTKRGKPVARLVPIVVPPKGFGALRDVTTILASDEELFSTGDTWNVE